VKKPPKRSDIPPRNSDNDKRRLAESVSNAEIEKLVKIVSYRGSPKHKRNPRLFNLESFNGIRGDATLCDEHANFRAVDMQRIPELIVRGLKAGLIGTNIWTVGDDGWIFEGRLTNATQSEYHGYPVRPSEAIAEPIYQRFKEWADANGAPADKRAALNCAALYKFK